MMRLVFVVTVAFAACTPYGLVQDEISKHTVVVDDRREMDDGAQDRGLYLRRSWLNDQRNWIDFKVERSHAIIEGYAPIFVNRATLSITVEHSLKSQIEFVNYCKTQDYKTTEGFTGFLGTVKFEVNPLNQEVARRLASSKTKSILKVNNPFVIKDIKFDIIAPFMSEEEKALIRARPDLIALTIMDEVNVNIFGIQIGLEHEKKTAFIRFLCGMAHSEAELHYELVNKEGKKVYIHINGVSFKS